MISLIGNIFQQYGGFYQHNIESALSGAERLFTLMGYRATGQKSLSLEGPVEQDAVTKVARDCILAYMECQVPCLFNYNSVQTITESPL